MSWIPLAAAAIGAFGSVLSNRASARASVGANAANLAHQERWNQQSQANWFEAMHHSVGNRVNDARRAGISPLAALGMPGSGGPASFSVGGQVPVRGGHAGAAMKGVAAAMMDHEDRKLALEHRRIDESREARRDMYAFEDRRARHQLDVVRAQVLASQLELANRRLQHMGRDAEEAMPLYIAVRDNREELRERGHKGLVALNPPLAESYEGLGPLVISGSGTAGNQVQNQWERLKSLIREIGQ